MSGTRRLLPPLAALATLCSAPLASAEPTTRPTYRLGGAVGTTALSGNHVLLLPLAASARVFGGFAWFEPEATFDIDWAGNQDRNENGDEHDGPATFVMYGLGLRAVPWWRSFASPYVTLQLHDVVPPTTSAFLTLGPRGGIRLRSDRAGFYLEGGASIAIAGEDHWFSSSSGGASFFPQVSGGVDFLFDTPSCGQ